MFEYIDREKLLKFVIQEDLEVGFYLYVYDLTSGECIKDYLQDTLEIVQRQAARMYNVPASAWVKVIK